MNTLEKNVLELLSSDARLGAEAIASMLGEQPSAVKALIRSLEERGAIVKYTVISNGELLDEGFDWMAKQIAAHAEVKGVYLMSGGYDLAVFVECASLKKVARFVSERISTFEGVLSTATHFILKKYKIEGALTERADTDNRLSVQP